VKAIRLYGSRGSEKVILEEVPIPPIAEGEVLVRGHATAITPGELQWYPTLHTPKGDPRSRQILSHEFSGVIEEIAPGLKGVEKGDAVYGLNNWFIDGAAAEYCISNKRGLLHRRDQTRAALRIDEIDRRRKGSANRQRSVPV
jgi:NADPH:quinone reductase-like Zn-dependent oxidoreductase